ncbi:MAG: ribosome silencing factor [Candidatus Hydrogenedentota bacterium]
MPELVRKSESAEPEIHPNVFRIADLLDARKGAEIRAYDVRGLTLVADTFIMCNASSAPQLKALVNSVKDGMKDLGVAPLAVEGEGDVSWIVMDYGTILVHLFRDEAREFYDLDGLWGDAPQIDLAIGS